MRSSFMGFEVSKRSIQMSQKALDITNNNMGNIETKGYTRQRLDTASLYISSYTYWQTRLSKLSLAGQGVTAFGVSQIRNAYLDKRYRDTICYQYEYNAKIEVMQEIETAIDNIDTVGLTTAFNQLKTALSKVSLIEPDAKDMCSLVRNEAQNICSMLRAYDADLKRLLQNNLGELEQSISGANNLVDKIVYFNKQIVNEYASTDFGRVMSGQGVSEYGPLELLDQRNVLLDELAQYGDIQVFQNTNGSVRVTMGGTEIINDQELQHIVMRSYDDYNAAVLSYSNGEQVRLNSGEIKAYVDMVNGHGPYAAGKYQNSEYGIPYYIDAINAFATEFANLMNETNGMERDYNTYTFNGTKFWDAMTTTPAPGDPDTRPVFTITLGTKTVTIAPDTYEDFADETDFQTWLNDEFKDENGDPLITFAADGTTFTLKANDSKTYFKISQDNNTDAGMREVVLQEHDSGRRLITGTPDVWQEFYNRNNAAYNFKDLEAMKSAYSSNTLLKNAFDKFSVEFLEEYAAADSEIDVTAANIHVSDAWMNNEIMIGETFNYVKGEWDTANLDGSNLQRFIMALEAKRDWGRAMDFTNGTAFDYLFFLSNRVGQGIEFYEDQLSATINTANELMNNRDAISAVSDTEEGMNLLMYQKWFNASARIMTALDECIDKVINGMGRCGL